MARMEQQHTPTTEELAAAIAAISLMLDQQNQPQVEERAGWIASARLAVQRMPPRRVHTLPPSWSTAERLRRGLQDGFTGITGV
jgi:hypothetical protein